MGDIRPSAARQRWLRLALRVLAAVGGGYLLASGAAASLALGLPALGLRRVDATVAGWQTGFVVHVAAAIWAFSPVPVARVWGVTAALAAGMAAFCGAMR